MAARNLTSKFVESVKPTPGKQAGYPDATVRGLELRVSGEGRKTWSLRYRTAEGKQSRLSLGVFPAVELADARSAAIKALAAVADGKDPAAEKQASKRAYKAQPIKTVGDLAEVYFAACERGEWKPKGRRKRASSIKAERNIWKVHVQPGLAKQRVEALSRAGVRDFLRGMVDKGLGARVNRAQALIRQLFNFAISEGRVQANPTAYIPALVEERPRERILSDDELSRLWAGLEDPTGLKLPLEKPNANGGADVQVGEAPRLAVQLCALLLQRRAEVAGMAVAELDLGRGVWIIPPERMKSARPHVVPLPPEAVRLIRRALEIRAHPDSPFVFPGRLDKSKPMAPLSVGRAMVTICAALGIANARPHDLRRTGASVMTSERLGIRRFIVSHVLGHAAADGAAITAVYDRHDYMPEKRQALEAWEGLLLRIVGKREPAPSNVTPLRPAL